MRTRVHGPHVGVLASAILLLGLLLPGAANAQAEYGLGEPNAYLAGSILAAFDKREDLWFWNWGSADVEPGFTLRAGLRLGDPLAMEIQGDYIRTQQWRDDNNWTLTMNFRFYPTQYDSEWLLGMDVSEMLPKVFQPYIVAGAGVIGGSGEENNDSYSLAGAFRVGAGTDFYVSEQVALSFGYEWIVGTSSWAQREVRNLTLGVQYNF